MTTHVPDAIDGIVAACTSAVSGEDAEVVDSWVAAVGSATKITIGVPDSGLRDIGQLTTPAASVIRSDPLGYDPTGQIETVAVRCQIETAPVDQAPDPVSVRAETARIFDLCLAALPGSVPGAQTVYATDDVWFQADGPSGWQLFMTFTIRAVFLT